MLKRIPSLYNAVISITISACLQQTFQFSYKISHKLNCQCCSWALPCGVCSWLLPFCFGLSPLTDNLFFTLPFHYSAKEPFFLPEMVIVHLFAILILHIQKSSAKNKSFLLFQCPVIFLFAYSDFCNVQRDMCQWLSMPLVNRWQTPARRVGTLYDHEAKLATTCWVFLYSLTNWGFFLRSVLVNPISGLSLLHCISLFLESTSRHILESTDKIHTHYFYALCSIRYQMWQSHL